MQVRGASKFIKALVVLLLARCGSLLARDSGVTRLRLRELLQDNNFAPIVFLAARRQPVVSPAHHHGDHGRSGVRLLVWSALGVGWKCCRRARRLRFDAILRKRSGLVKPSEWSRFGSVVRHVEQGGWRAVAMLRLIPAIRIP